MTIPLRSGLGSHTRQRILEAACEAFAESGYDGTSVRTIVARAGTNVASVNYHFGSKEILYQEVIQTTFSDICSEVEATLTQITHIDDPVARIRQFAIKRLQTGIVAPETGPPRLLGWEIVSPKVGVDDLYTGGYEAIESSLIALLDPLFTSNVTVEQMGLAARWFLANTTPLPPVQEQLRKILGPTPSQDLMDEIFGHMADAAIAGVSAIVTPEPLSQ